MYDKKSRSYVERETQEVSEAFYAEDGRFEIPELLKEETLFAFIERLARWFEEAYDDRQKRERKARKLGDWLEERALKNFLDFIRKNSRLLPKIETVTGVWTNRVGGSLSAPVLSHHRTYGTVYGGS